MHDFKHIRSGKYYEILREVNAQEYVTADFLRIATKYSRVTIHKYLRQLVQDRRILRLGKPPHVIYCNHDHMKDWQNFFQQLRTTHWRKKMKTTDKNLGEIFDNELESK